jgi:hypothetical protein
MAMNIVFSRDAKPRLTQGSRDIEIKNIVIATWSKLNTSLLCCAERCSYTGSSNNDSGRIQSPQDRHPRLLAGDAVDSGIITETGWDAVTIAWNSGQVARVHRGDMR